MWQLVSFLSSMSAYWTGHLGFGLFSQTSRHIWLRELLIAICHYLPHFYRLTNEPIKPNKAPLYCTRPKLWILTQLFIFSNASSFSSSHCILLWFYTEDLTDQEKSYSKRMIALWCCRSNFKTQTLLSKLTDSTNHYLNKSQLLHMNP